MQPTILVPNTKEYVYMEIVAKMLTLLSPNEKKYTVETVYFDYGQRWKWTTIIREDAEWGGVQALNPKQFRQICLAESLADLDAVIKDIREDRFFGDK